MTEEYKDLLLKDLCSRLPYGVKGVLCDDCTCTLDRIWTKKGYESVIIAGDYYDIEDFKPYLFPLSSMNEEQDKEFALLQTSAGKEGFLYAWNCANMMKWLIENHFDYNGLIEKGLAIDATNKNIF
jgi:hypothetical protein